ncbi:hypothetical protein SDC9_126750 [bioreactor metagenome]|uniref:Uncharacterized protein n=1 Tax=bioreactor metagenome TaxID=1076179 RepID=A0A645CRJ0_9ZZZZ
MPFNPVDISIKVNAVKVIVNDNILPNKRFDDLFGDRYNRKYITFNDFFNLAWLGFKFSVDISGNNIPCFIFARQILVNSEDIAFAFKHLTAIHFIKHGNNFSAVIQYDFKSIIFNCFCCEFGSVFLA